MSLIREMMQDPEFQKEFARERFYFHVLEAIHKRKNELGWTDEYICEQVNMPMERWNAVEDGETILTLTEIADIFLVMDKWVALDIQDKKGF